MEPRINFEALLPEIGGKLREIMDHGRVAAATQRNTGGGGWPGNCGREASICAHAGASETQMLACGLNRCRSSRLPARKISKWGRSSASLVTCTPHCGQKPRCM